MEIFLFREYLSIEVVVIGGGIVGLLIVYELSWSGKFVIVLEDGYCGSGEMGCILVYLICIFDWNFSEYVYDFGEEKVYLFVSVYKYVIDYIELIVWVEKIECDFRWLLGYLYLYLMVEKDFVDKEFEVVEKCGLLVICMNVVFGFIFGVEGICVLE